MSGVLIRCARGTGTAVLAIVMLVAASCAPLVTPPQSAEPSARPIILAGNPMTPCRLGGNPAVCGTLRVPEDPRNPSGRAIDLRVMVLPAASAEAKADPLFLLSGGPGGAATYDFGWTPSIFQQLHAERDFVMVDQRGTGGSNRMMVPALPDMNGLPEEEIVAKIAEVLAGLPGDLRFYTTFVAMEDLDAVRQALGYDQINLYGASYGATAAQYYLRQHGDHVRAVVLDGGTLLDVPVFERMAANSQRALEIQFDRCFADAACRQAYPDLRAEFAAVLVRLQTGSISTAVVDPNTGEPIVIDATTFASALHGALVSAATLSELPSLVHTAYLGDWTLVADAIRAQIVPEAADVTRLVMSVVIRCSEAWARFDPSEVARLAGNSYGREAMVAAARNQARTCQYTPRGVVPDGDDQPVRSSVPALFIVGEADPQDPPGNIADASIELPNSRTLVVPGQAHTVGHVGCMPTVIAAFIHAGTAAGLDGSCVNTKVPVPTFRTTP